MLTDVDISTMTEFTNHKSGNHFAPMRLFPTAMFSLSLRSRISVNFLRLHNQFSIKKMSLVEESYSENSKLLYDTLLKWRNETAILNNYKRPSAILSNVVLQSLVNLKPKQKRDLARIEGFTKKTYENHGDVIIEIIRQMEDDPTNVTISKTVNFANEQTENMKTSKITTTSTTILANNQGNIDSKPIINSNINVKTASNQVISNSPSISHDNNNNKLSPPRLEYIADDPLAFLQHTVDGQFIAPQLTEEQISVANSVLKDGSNVFITGAAGTGKSVLLRHLVKELREIHGHDAVAVTATTGIAAVNVGGQTVHSFAGLILAKDSDGKLNLKSFRTSASKKRWKDTKVLVVDEISMLGPEVFELLDEIARNARKDFRPFGGVQLVLFGDFLQLPPVKMDGDGKRFCFESPLWERSGLSGPKGTRELSFSVRQKNDTNFASLLNRVRLGRIPPDLLADLNKCYIGTKLEPSDGIIPTKLYCTNRDVDKENNDRLKELPGASVIITAVDQWINKTAPAAAEKKIILEQMEKKIPTKLELKIGAQVVLLRNRAPTTGEAMTLSNGCRGVVTAFEKIVSGGFYPIVKFDDGQEVIVPPCEWKSVGEKVSGAERLVRRQIPLKLAWALTVHKSQGLTLTRAQLTLADAFDCGQAYTALSRVTGTNGLWLSKPIVNSNIKASPVVLQYYGYN
eukprot:gene4269-8495_t